MKDHLKPADSASASVRRAAPFAEDVLVPKGHFVVWCVGADGVEKWRDTIKNTVMTLGKNDMLDKYLKGVAYTQTIRMGLCGVGTKDPADSQGSHAWLEVGLANAPQYTGNRKTVVMGAAADGISVSPVQAFVIAVAGGTVAGAFINNGGLATKDDTTGVLFSAGNFTEGNRVVVVGDTINVTYALSI